MKRSSHMFPTGQSMGLGSGEAPMKPKGFRVSPQAIMTVAVSLFVILPSLPPSHAAPQAVETSSSQYDHHVTAHWAYLGVEGPDHWAILHPDFKLCEIGTKQSPINIQMVRHTHHSGHLTFHYQPARVWVVNTGHTIQVNYPSGSMVIHNGRLYQLRQFHFHHPSEHEIHTLSYPMEMHLVHQDAKGHILVVGVFVEQGESNPVLNAWWDRLPRHSGEVADGGLINAKDLLPSSSHHFSYHGSLTTPPCSEGVQWIVLRNPVSLSPEQILRFIDVIGNNARPIQVRHGRSIEEE